MGKDGRVQNRPKGNGPLALVGSGEYLPEMAEVEAGLLEGRPPRYVQLATASVPDGPSVVARWHALGRAQAGRIGVEAVVLAVSDRGSADDPLIAAQVAGAGLVYLSGGHPAFLAETLRSTLVWEAVLAAWREGAALAGCSAGAMALSSRVPSLRHPGPEGVVGLGLLPHVRVIPHFDAFVARAPGLVSSVLGEGGGGEEGVSVVGIDELTALVGGPEHWEVKGRGSAWLLRPDGRVQVPAGATLETPC